MKRAAVWLLIVVSLGCHADPNDAAGQAGELADPVRRANAIANITRLYTGTLSKNAGDRANADVKAIVDATIDKLVETYTAHPEDSIGGGRIMDLLLEMQDARALLAVLAALKWQADVSEQHAITAAKALQTFELPDADRDKAVEGVGAALDRVSGARGVDNRMRIEFIRTLGALGSKRATPILEKVATTQTEEQNFLINIMAAQQLGALADPASVPTLVKCLFLFAPNTPTLRMDDAATEALVRIGRPSLDPLLAMLRGENAEVNALVEQTIAAVRAKDERAASKMSAQNIRSYEATYALGWLGFREALDPLLAETQSDDVDRRFYGALGLPRLVLEPADRTRVREAMVAAYGGAQLEQRAQLLAMLRTLYDGELLPFLAGEMENRENHPLVRLEAAKAYAFLANRAEAENYRALVEAEPKSEDGGEKENLAKFLPVLELASQCDVDVACWVGKLGGGDPLELQKAAYMLGRFGRDNAQAIDALVGRLGHPDNAVRDAAVEALDRVAVHGSEAAVKRISELQELEEGRAIWKNFKGKALPVQARLRTRG